MSTLFKTFIQNPVDGHLKLVFEIIDQVEVGENTFFVFCHTVVKCTSRLRGQYPVQLPDEIWRFQMGFPLENFHRFLELNCLKSDSELLNEIDRSRQEFLFNSNQHD